MAFPDSRLYLLFTPALCVGDPRRTLEQALAAGVDLVQWRVAAPDADGLQRCREICSARSVPVLVNDDVMLAVRSRAHGAHVGADDMPAAAARRLLGDRWLGVSTHDLAQIRAAVDSGADYIGFGPCFPTATKGYAEGQPDAAIAAAVAAATAAALPLFAIGGITADNLPRLRRLGVQRIAVSAAILQAADPFAATTALCQQLRRPARH